MYCCLSSKVSLYLTWITSKSAHSYRYATRPPQPEGGDFIRMHPKYARQIRQPAPAPDSCPISIYILCKVSYDRSSFASREHLTANFNSRHPKSEITIAVARGAARNRAINRCCSAPEVTDGISPERRYGVFGNRDLGPTYVLRDAHSHAHYLSSCASRRSAARRTRSRAWVRKRASTAVVISTLSLSSKYAREERCGASPDSNRYGS